MQHLFRKDHSKSDMGNNVEIGVYQHIALSDCPKQPESDWTLKKQSS